MEEKGLPSFIKNIVAKEKLPFQVKEKTKRIQNSHTIPATKLGKDLKKIIAMSTLEDIEYIACIIDLESRDVELSKFRDDLKKAAGNADNIVLGVAHRSMENWILGDAEELSKIKRTNSALNQKLLRKVDHIEHPAERAIKKYWPEYQKTKDGVYFLINMCPVRASKYSDSLKDFLQDLKYMAKLHENKSNRDCQKSLLITN